MIAGEHQESKLAKVFFEVIEEKCHIEKKTELTERLESIYERLHVERDGSPPKCKIVVPWFGRVSAFTITGEYIYVTRQLAQKLRFDDQLAFVVAHEIGHLDLGHLPKATQHPFLSKFTSIGIIEAQFRNTTNRYQKECDADEYALRLCERAGYDREKAVSSFDRMLGYARIKGASDVAYGTWASLDEEVQGKTDLKTKARQWCERKKFRYPSLAKRKKRLLEMDDLKSDQCG